MSKLQDFLMKYEAAGEMQEVKIKGFPAPFVVKSISEAENKAIKKECQYTTIDKRSRQKSVELNSDKYNNSLIVACCVEPNLKDAELQKHFGVMGAEALLDKIFNPGQYIDLLTAVMEVNGFSDADAEVEEAKN